MIGGLGRAMRNSVTIASRAAPQLIEMPSIFKQLGVPGPEKMTEQLQSYASWVYAAVAIRACRVAEMKMRLVLQTSGDEYAADAEPRVITNHPFIQLMKKPNPFTGRYAFIELHQIYLDLTGNCFWLKLRDPMGVTRQLWLLPPDRVKPIPNADTFISGYYYTPPGEEERIPIPVDDIIHFKYPSPVDPYFGWSPLRAAAYAYDINKYVQIYERSFFKEGARFDFALQTDGDLTKEQVNRLYDYWIKSHRGVEKAWRPAILTGGMKAIPLNQVNKDFEFASLAKWTKDEILGIYHTPEAMLGHAHDVNRSTADSLEVIFTRNAIVPCVHRLEEGVEENLLPDYPGQTPQKHFELEFDSPVPPDREQILKENGEYLTKGVRTINEIRAQLGLKPVEFGDSPYMQIQYVPLANLQDNLPGKAVQSPNVPADVANDKPKPTKTVTFTNPDGTVVTVEVGTKAAGDHPHPKLMSKLEDYFRPSIVALFDDQEKRQLAHMREIMGTVRDPDLVARLMLKMEVEVRTWVDGMVTKFVTAYDMVVKTVAHAYGIATVFDASDSKAIVFLSDKLNIFAYTTNSETRKLLSASLLEGIRQSENQKQLADRIKGIFLTARTSRVDLIAQTEAVAIVNSAAEQLYRSEGIIGKQWWTQEDEKVRMTHAAAHGQVVPIFQRFSVGGSQMRFPGDPSAPMKEIARCRCFVVPRNLME